MPISAKPKSDLLTSLPLACKGAILIGLPFLCIVIFAAVTYSAIDRAELELAKSEYARKVTSKIAMLGPGLFGMASAAHEVISHKTQATDVYAQRKAAIEANLAELRLLLADRPGDLAVVNRIQSIFSRAYMLLDEAIRSEELGDLDLSLKTLERISSLKAELLLQSDKLVNAYRKLEEESPARQTAFRNSMKQNLMILLVGIVAVDSMLAFIFYKDILNRLQTLVHNTHRLAKGQSLLQRIHGADEVGHLDNVFHDMAESLFELEQKKAQFVAMLTHDLRAPLSSVRLVMQLLTQGVYGDKLTDKGADALSKAEVNMSLMLNIINNLLDVEKAAAGKLDLECEEVPLAHILEQSYQLLRPQAELKGVALKVDQTELEVFVDSDKLTRVVANLLGNALKFTPDESTVRVRVLELDQQFQISVQDEGPGIPVEYREKLFQRFHQVDLPSHKLGAGTGLGLLICKEIVTLHGGIIGIISEQGQGSTFWFQIPKRCAAVNAVTASNVEQPVV